MSKDFMNPHLNLEREVETQPTNEAARLENHILAESFDMNHLDIDKIQRQSKELESMELGYKG